VNAELWLSSEALEGINAVGRTHAKTLSRAAADYGVQQQFEQLNYLGLSEFIPGKFCPKYVFTFVCEYFWETSVEIASSSIVQPIKGNTIRREEN